jgi:hypothetical protein
MNKKFKYSRSHIEQKKIGLISFNKSFQCCDFVQILEGNYLYCEEGIYLSLWINYIYKMSKITIHINKLGRY